ncbi:MAG: methyltransferase domain-containing protein [Niastella sp.]|nr:methyltransferase domain-containing protein [Niastella sp.]
MSVSQPPATNHVRQQNIAYYDEIADQYDTILTQDTSNLLVRQQVKDQLVQAVPAGTILDFGGGTGLDLGWLTDNQYQVIFCEPAASMREKAIQYSKELLHHSNIRFLDDSQTDFIRWRSQLPSFESVDGILANFGVLNAISEIGLLFQHLSLVTKSGGHCFITILDRPLKMMWQWHRRNTINTLLFNRPFVMYVWHKDYRQTVYVHTSKEIQQAAAPYFKLNSCRPVTGTSFILLHLVKQ